MLNAGLATLDHLKSRILPLAATQDTDYDTALSELGLAIARRMEGHCARSFDRGVAVVDIFSAWTLSVILRRYPVESIATIQIKSADSTLRTCDTPWSFDAGAGLVDFASVPGNRTQRLVITYTGGWWLNDGTTMPETSTPLPDDILELWIAEVQRHAEARGLFEAVGLRSAKDADRIKPTAGLSDDTIDGLRPYRRFSGE